MNYVFSNITLTWRYMCFKVIYSTLYKNKGVSAPLKQSTSQKLCQSYKQAKSDHRIF